MLYHVSRNGQSYGPYTLEDLQRYLASGNVLPTDQVKSDEMADWTTVAQLLSGQTSGQIYDQTAGTPPAANPPYAPLPGTPSWPNPTHAPAGLAANPNLYPDAPNLNWGLVLLFAILTCSLFMYIWNLVVAAWVKRVQPESTSLYYYIAAGVLALIQGVVGFGYGAHNAIVAMQGSHSLLHQQGIGIRVGLGLIVWVVRLIARFQQRESLLQHFNGPEPLGLQLSGVMTFFFGGLYFQYHLNRLNMLKQAARYGAPRY